MELDCSRRLAIAASIQNSLHVCRNVYGFGIYGSELRKFLDSKFITLVKKGEVNWICATEGQFKGRRWAPVGQIHPHIHNETLLLTKINNFYLCISTGHEWCCLQIWGTDYYRLGGVSYENRNKMYLRLSWMVYIVYFYFRVLWWYSGGSIILLRAAVYNSLYPKQTLVGRYESL